MENKVPLIPTALPSHQTSSQAGSIPASFWLEAGSALESAILRLKQAHVSFPASSIHTEAAHKVLGTQPSLAAPSATAPKVSAGPLAIHRSCTQWEAGKRHSPAKWSKAAEEQCFLSSFLTQDIWVTVCPELILAGQGWCPAVQTHSSYWFHLSPQSSEKNRGELVITALTFNLFLFHMLHEHFLKKPGSQNTQPCQILMYKLLKVFSPFSLHKVPYGIFACFFTNQKEARWRPTEEREKDLRSLSAHW